jgi:hypothetical protein
MLIQADAKVCPCCLVIKPIIDFYFVKGKPKSYCKPCHIRTNNQDKERRKINSAEYYQRRKETNPELFLWKQAKHRSYWDYDDMEFTIEVSDIVIPDKCPYLNLPFGDGEMAPSLDRIDSTKGYIKDNIRVISRLANRMKTNATEEELIQFAKGVLALHTQGGN